MFGVGSIPWSPLGRGLLTRPVSEQSTRGDTDWFIKNYKGAGTPDVINRSVLSSLHISPSCLRYSYERFGVGW